MIAAIDCYGKEKDMYEKYVKLRDSAGISDYRVSKDTGISYSTFKDWAKGIYNPKVDKIQKLSMYFKVPLDYFYTEA